MQRKYRKLGIFLVGLALTFGVCLTAFEIPFDREGASSRRVPALGSMAGKVILIQADCDKIRKGMTQRQVEEILGMPPGNYATVEYLYDEPIISVRDFDRKSWTSDNGEVLVWFDANDKVSAARFRQLPLTHKETGAIQNDKWYMIILTCGVGISGFLLLGWPSRKALDNRPPGGEL